MEQTLFNYITKEEQEMIDWYRNSFSNAYSNSSNEKVELRKILQPWEDSKGDLFKLLGNNLIISKEVNYKKSNDELVENFEDRLYSRDETGERKKELENNFMMHFLIFEQRIFLLFSHLLWIIGKLLNQQKPIWKILYKFVMV